MNLIKSEIKKMSSKEIAELTEKRHDHVIRDIKNMFSELKTSHTPFLGDELSERGKYYPVFYLPKEETLILVSGYSVKMRANIIHRWLELEKSILPQSFSEALQLAADQAKQLEEQQPKVEFHDRVTQSDNTFTMQEACKVLNLKFGRNTFMKKLRGIKFLMRDSRIPYQRHITLGNAEVIETEKNGIVVTSTTLTQKGISYLSKRFPVEYFKSKVEIK